jgi:hypothetical protein
MKVLAVHPRHQFAFAPGEITSLQVGNDQSKLTVRFFDFVETGVPRQDAYLTDHWKMHMDIEDIRSVQRRSSAMHDYRQSLPQLDTKGQVLAKWPDDGWYYPATIKSEVTNGEFILERYIDNNLHSVKNVKREDIISRSQELHDNNVYLSFFFRHGFDNFIIYKNFKHFINFLF